MNLYTVTFWLNPEDPDVVLEVQIGARTEEAALAEARMQNPDLINVPTSITLDWKGKP